MRILQAIAGDDVDILAWEVLIAELQSHSNHYHRRILKNISITDAACISCVAIPVLHGESE